jgi:succinate dehydrogenase / fumarate reductase cytochrome b subunit
MTHNPLIKTISYVNYAIFLAHIAWAVALTIYNRQARGAERYAVTSSKSSIWSSRNMGILGTVILVFLVIHMRQFWGEMHFGSVPMKTYGDHEVCGIVWRQHVGNCFPPVAWIFKRFSDAGPKPYEV